MPAIPLSFLGLGSMGLPMASNLIDQGFPLTVYNRSKGRAGALAARGAVEAATPRDSVQPGGTAITMLANDLALEHVCLGEQGLLARLGRGGLHISMSTVSPETSRRLAKAHAEAGCAFIAAPVFGRPEAAAARKLWICQSGPADARQRARPVLEALGQGVFDFGEEIGAANVVKLCGNFLIMSAIEAMAEAMALGEKAGIGREELIGFFGQTVFNCPLYQNYGRILAQRQYEPAGFKLELGMKDVRLVRETAEQELVTMPLADLLHGRLLTSLAQGRYQMDWTAIELVTAQEAGLAPQVSSQAAH